MERFKDKEGPLASNHAGCRLHGNTDEMKKSDGCRCADNVSSTTSCWPVLNGKRVDSGVASGIRNEIITLEDLITAGSSKQLVLPEKNRWCWFLEPDFRQCPTARALDSQRRRNLKEPKQTRTWFTRGSEQDSICALLGLITVWLQVSRESSTAGIWKSIGKRGCKRNVDKQQKKTLQLCPLMMKAVESQLPSNFLKQTKRMWGVRCPYKSSIGYRRFPVESDIHWVQ